MRQNGIKKAVWIVLYCAAAMGVMLFFMKHKAITIANVEQDQVIKDTGGDGTEQELRFRLDDSGTDYLCIPLENGVRPEDVTIENHYMDRQVWIYIANCSADYYRQEAISGNIDRITAGSYTAREGTTLLKFSLEDVFECSSVMEENCLYIEFVPPKEMYPKIVVLDAGCGGEDNGCEYDGRKEKDLTLDIVKRLKLLLDRTDIKVYYTRTEDVTVSGQERAAFANAVDADFLIGVRLAGDEDPAVYGVITEYNDEYFIPWFDNAKLADLVERNVVLSTCNRGIGLRAAEETDTLLQEAGMPAAVLYAGHMSNPKEAALLAQPDYRDSIAEGLYNAILAAFAERESK